MPAYISEPTASQGPVTGQQNQLITTIPGIVAGVPYYSWGHADGYAEAPTQNAEVSETMPASGTAGRQVALRSFSGLNQNSPAVTWSYTIGGTATGNIMTLEGSITDITGQYYTIDTGTTGAAQETRTAPIGQERINFLRIKVSTAGGSATSVIAKLLV